MPAIAKTQAAVQLPAPSGLDDQDREDGNQREARDRQRVRELRERSGDCAGRHGSMRILALRAEPSRIRERAQPRLPAAAARAQRGRRLLGLARVDAGRGRAGHRRRRPARLRRRLPGDAGGRLHGRRASSTTWASRRPGGRGGRRGGRDRDRPPPRRVRARRDRAVPPGVGRPRTSPRSRQLREAGAERRRRAPLRSRLPVGLARGDRALRRARGLVLHVHADEQPREIEECCDEHGIRPIELLAADRLPRPAHDDRPRHPRLGRRARPPRGRRARGSAPARRPRRTSATASSPWSGSAPAGSGSASASDSNVRIDPLEELRELEGVARRHGAAPQGRPAGGAARDRHAGGRRRARPGRLGPDRDRHAITAPSRALRPTRCPPRSSSAAARTSVAPRLGIPANGR